MKIRFELGGRGTADICFKGTEGIELSGSIYMQISTKGNGNLVRVNEGSNFSRFR